MENAVATGVERSRFGMVAAPVHTVVVLALLAVGDYLGAIRSGQLRAAASVDRVALYGRTIFLELLMLGVVLLGVWLHGVPFASVLGERWRSRREVLQDVGIALAFWVGSTLVVSVLGGHQHGGGTDRAVQFLFPQTFAENILWVVLSITAGICEEAVYRSYLQRQFMALTKNAPAGILLSALVFSTGHAYQGWAGAARIGVGGILLGILAHWRGSVRPGMMAHAWGDAFAGVLARMLRIRVG
jgi:membrane protease YdiL (CAAX protease family)